MLKAKTVLTATIGNAIVYYDITLYGFFTAFLSPLFFPAENLVTSQLASLGAFAAGFMARPFGGVIFGHIGDRYGRKRALVVAMLLVTIPTVIIGVLPTYSSIGILAPIILVLCKLAQGICTGGEYSGAAIFLSEHHRGHSEGLAGSILPATSIAGAILGSSLGGLCTLSEMPSWAWRIPFLLGGVFGIIAYFLRSTLMESPEFVTTQKEKHLVKLPILEVVKQDKRAFFCTLWISAYNLVLFYTPVVYIVQFMMPKDTLVSSSMFLNTGFMFLLIVLFPLMGLAADRFGKQKIMMTGIIANFILALPLFFLINYENSLTNVSVVLIMFCLFSAFSVSPSVSFLPTLFPVQSRYSALALAIGLGEALGGTTPFICHGFVTAMGTPIAPAFFLMICSILGWVAIKYSKSKVDSFEPIGLKAENEVYNIDTQILRNRV